MISHLNFTIHFRVPFEQGLHVASSCQPASYLTLCPITIQPAVQALIDAAGLFVGVGIHEDLKKFNELLELLSGQRLQFQPPIDAATVARLAGYNLSRYGVATLAWTLIGTTIPKGVVSVGDGMWHRRLGEIPEELQLYARCDTQLVAACFYLLVTCWVFHVMPEFDVITCLSVAKHPRHLLACSAHTRLEAMRLTTAGSKHQPRLALLTLDWPALTAGGCRYLHTARSWLHDRLMTVTAINSDF
jgi:hypothetical protein